MLQDAHSRKIALPVTAAPGDTIVVAAIANTWLYIHDLIGDMDATGTFQVLTGSTVRASFTLDAGQGITLADEPGEDNRPRFECKPGDDFILRVTGGTFTGGIHYSLRN